MKTTPFGVRRSLFTLIRGGSFTPPPFDDDEPPKPPRVWANAAELLDDQFGLHAA